MQVRWFKAQTLRPQKCIPVIRALVTLPRLGAFSAALLMLWCGKNRQHSSGCSVAKTMANTCRGDATNSTRQAAHMKIWTAEFDLFHWT